MPEHFADLVTISGLGAMVVFVLAGLKRLPARNPDSWGWKVREWVAENLFVTSILIAVVFGVGAWLVMTFASSHLELVEELWQLLLVIWGASQIIYNTQKGVTRAARRE